MSDVTAPGAGKAAILPLPLGAVRLTGGVYEDRRALNEAYLAELTVPNLLQNYYLEAGLGEQQWHLRCAEGKETLVGRENHWGWESPTGQLRGHFLGHWMSAAARHVAVTGDSEMRGKLQKVVDELARCQRENGDGWVFSIPPRYLKRLAEGKPVWAPQYTMHKTFMGLVDAYREAGISEALPIAEEAARYMHSWITLMSPEQRSAVVDVETGGMLEVWADLLEITGDEIYRELLDLYWHDVLFDALLEGQDPLTNMHANTTIPEALGAARAFEVTGEDRWRRVVEAYWRVAVDERGTFATGGQTSGEIWTPPFEFAARRGEKTQEHCAVYNMIRLADVLFRWTGDAKYLDYIELNLLNGILAQQNPQTGMVAYFLPLEGGARKAWGSRRDDFWCCHGTLVQAHTRHEQLAFYLAPEGEVVVAQFLNAAATIEDEIGETRVSMELRDTSARVGPDANAARAGARRRPDSWGVVISVTGAPRPLRIRIPEWVAGEAVIETAGEERVAAPGTWVEVKHEGDATEVELTLPHQLTVVPIPDEPQTVAFRSGPTLLAGLTDAETALMVSQDADPTDYLVPDNERQWGEWLRGWRTVGQPKATRLLPVAEIVDEPFSVYFPLLRSEAAAH